MRVFAEALRLLRRAPHAEAVLAAEMSEQEAFDWQMSRLAALEPALTDYLQECPRPLTPPCCVPGGAGAARVLLRPWPTCAPRPAPAVLPLLGQPRYPHAELAVEVLTWSRDPRVGPWLASWAAREVPLDRRAQRRRRLPAAAAAVGAGRRALPRDPAALRGHPPRQTEAFLLLAARDWDPTYRAAAVSSLGWWEPFQPDRRASTTCRRPAATPTPTSARPPAPPWPAWANGRRCSGSARR